MEKEHYNNPSGDLEETLSSLKAQHLTSITTYQSSAHLLEGNLRHFEEFGSSFFEVGYNDNFWDKAEQENS